LRFCGHIAGSAPDEDHHHAVAAAIRKPPSDWKRPPGRPNHTWLRAIEQDLKPLNIGPSDTWKKSASREHWRSIVDTATLKEEYANEETERERVESKIFWQIEVLTEGTMIKRTASACTRVMLLYGTNDDVVFYRTKTCHHAVLVVMYQR